MPPENFTADIREFLSLMWKHGAEYLIIGGDAVIYYGHARLTGDFDIYYNNTPANVRRVFNAINEFWAGAPPLPLQAEELLEPGVIFQYGVPPNRLDLTNSIDGVDFKGAWKTKIQEMLDLKEQKVPIYYIGKGALIRNKQAMGRPKDLDDLQFLLASPSPNPAKND